MTRAQWLAACKVRVCQWFDRVWVGNVVVATVRGTYRVTTPDGVDRPVLGATPAEALASVLRHYDEDPERWDGLS